MNRQALFASLIVLSGCAVHTGTVDSPSEQRAKQQDVQRQQLESLLAEQRAQHDAEPPKMRTGLVMFQVPPLQVGPSAPPQTDCSVYLASRDETKERIRVYTVELDKKRHEVERQCKFIPSMRSEGSEYLAVTSDRRVVIADEAPQTIGAFYLCSRKVDPEIQRVAREEMLARHKKTADELNLQKMDKVCGEPSETHG